MSFQVFTGSSVNEAKQQMRSNLGADAVILSTRRREDGRFELRAIRKGAPLFEGEAGGPTVPSKPMNAVNATQDYTPTGSADQNQQRNASNSALNALKGNFSDKLTRGDDFGGDEILRDYTHVLNQHGLSKKLITALASAAHSAPEQSEPRRLTFALSRVLHFAPLQLRPDAPIMLLGQTGAGKTSSAAKLAARAANMGQRMAFMSADVGRAGAMDQMRTYAHALDTRFWAIEEPEDVRTILLTERPQEMLVLDTPGVSPFAPADLQAMRLFRDAISAEPILVLPASGDAAEHFDWATAFREIGVQRCIITKFDTSRRVGAAINACYESKLALAFFSEAPFISEGLVDANPEYLAHRLLISQPARIASAL